MMLFEEKDSKNNNWSDTIQIFRAIAIIAVVLSHICPLGVCTVVCRPF